MFSLSSGEGNAQRLINDGQQLSHEVSARITAFYHRAKHVILSAYSTLLIACEIYCCCIILLNGYYLSSVNSLTIMIVGLPVYILLITYVALYIDSFLILSSRYLQLRQQTLLDRLRQLNHWLQNQNNRQQKVASKSQFTKDWQSYFRLNREWLAICRSIQTLAHFWSPLLTLIFPYYVFILCYCIYMSFFVEAEIAVLCLFALILFDMTSLFFVLIRECANVVRYNTAFMLENRRFYIAAFRGVMGVGDRRTYALLMLKVGTILHV